ncbi:MAG: lectin-like protein [Planctomycetota bacterium]
MSRLILSLVASLFLFAGTALAQSESALWPIESGGNGHLYEIIAVPGGITWDAAQAAAVSNGGYLATLTSAAENDFVYDNLASDPIYWQLGAGFITGPWIGGLQPVGSPEPAGGWEWVNGEGVFDGNYTNWRAGEPNDNPIGEDRVLFFGSSVPFNGWNDARNAAIVPSYIVEYPIPEPSTGVLVLAGVMAVRRRKF